MNVSQEQGLMDAKEELGSIIYQLGKVPSQLNSAIQDNDLPDDTLTDLTEVRAEMNRVRTLGKMAASEMQHKMMGR